MLDVVDLSGVHSCKVHYCDCPLKKKKWEQLLEIDLFPATLRSPATAFSLSILKHFDLLSSISKAAAMDFVTTIRRSTNNAFIDDVPVRILGFEFPTFSNCYFFRTSIMHSAVRFEFGVVFKLGSERENTME